MKKIFDQYINDIVEQLAIPDLMKMNGMVIAGGFATALYHTHLLPESMKKSVCRYMNIKGANFLDVRYVLDRIGDIDYWVLENSEAESFIKPWLERDEKGRVKFIKNDDEEIRKAFKEKNIFFEKATRYSLSFRQNYIDSNFHITKNMKQQIIRLRSYEDISDIFSDFDIGLCKVAWKDGYLYVSGEAEADFSFGLISTSKPLEGYDNSFQRVWSTLRVLKYYQRYGFQPTKKTLSEIQNMFIEAIEFLNEKVEDQEKNTLKKNFGPGFAFAPVQPVPQPTPTSGVVSWSLKVPEKVDDPYDKWKSRTVEQMRGYYRQLLHNIHLLLSFDDYNITMAAMLLDVEESTAKKALREYIEAGRNIRKMINQEVEEDSILDLLL